VYADTKTMPAPEVLSSPTPEIESSLLGVLLTADTAREGANALLDALSPVLGGSAGALAVRDRDGLTLHVLAEIGAPQSWPMKLTPQVAVSSQPAIDPATGTMVIPLRANGRVVGAVLLGDSAQGAELLLERQFVSLLETVGAVLSALVSRTDEELRRTCGLRSVDAILEGMAHQMANPLTGASAIAQLLEEDLADAGHRAAVGQIRQELTRAFTVLHDLLEFQRDTRAQDGILDLNAVVERIIRFRGYAIREQGIQLDVETTPDFAPVRVDARGLEQAMLIALHFAELQSHGTVNRRIGIRVRDVRPADVAVDVIDSGPGNVPELIADYFDLPFRSEHSAHRSAAERPDLGLADSILRGCGGSLHVSGSKTDGTTLTLVLPRANIHTSVTQQRRTKA